MEQELLARDFASLGNDSHWIEAYRRIRTIAFVQPEARSFSGDLIDDAVQTFMVRLQDAQVLREIANAQYPRAFVAKSIRNLLTDQSRAAQRSKSAIEDYGYLTPRLIPGPMMIHEVLDGLTAEEREMLYRRFWYGQSLGEIAEIQGLPYSTVAKRMFRLLAKMRELLGNVQ